MQTVQGNELAHKSALDEYRQDSQEQKLTIKIEEALHYHELLTHYKDSKAVVREWVLRNRGNPEYVPPKPQTKDLNKSKNTPQSICVNNIEQRLRKYKQSKLEMEAYVSKLEFPSSAFESNLI